ncbi:unnamed protein product [Lactuca saligna]|uniref:F-box domain-containing protein n=1 Tax=Lactuca saligna TaxID=75948 RepID=A0AA35YAL6_LACSI|nr:unnamed protein product [Lactuca saligna]
MEETLDWLKMPHELMANIIRRLDAKEILNSALKVCTTWSIICKDPAMWRIIDMHEPGEACDKDYDLEALTKQAIDLSCGELIDISIQGFGTGDLLHYIVLRSSKLKSFCLKNCDVTGDELSDAVKRVPMLEKLHLSYISIDAYDIEVIGQNCPQLKSFMLNSKEFEPHPQTENDNDALAIANNMPELRHLDLFDSDITNNGLKAILNGCPHLESLDVRMCYNLDLDGSLGKLCMEQIKDLKYADDSVDNSWFHYWMHEYDESYESDSD